MSSAVADSCQQQPSSESVIVPNYDKLHDDTRHLDCTLYSIYRFCLTPLLTSPSVCPQAASMRSWVKRRLRGFLSAYAPTLSWMTSMCSTSSCSSTSAKTGWRWTARSLISHCYTHSYKRISLDSYLPDATWNQVRNVEQDWCSCLMLMYAFESIWLLSTWTGTLLHHLI